MRGILLSVGALFLVGCGTPVKVTAPSDVAIEVGRPFPNLVLPSLADGRPSSLVQYRGKKILLHVFASW